MFSNILFNNKDLFVLIHYVIIIMNYYVVILFITLIVYIPQLMTTIIGHAQCNIITLFFALFNGCKYD